MPYVTRQSQTRTPSKASWWDDWYGLERDVTVIPDVDGPVEVDTGLITADGHAIYRTARPIGFGRDGEW